MRIAFFMRPDPEDVKTDEVKPKVSKISDEIADGLRAAGHEVEELVPEARPWDLLHLAHAAPEHDLYVLKSKNPLDLDLAETLERAGAQVVNTAQASRLVKDKIAHTPLLARAGVPQPDSWTVASKAALKELLEQNPMECLVKPPAGSMAQGIFSLSSAADLEKDEQQDLVEGFVDTYGQPAPLLVQRKVPNNGMDLKVYVVGDWVAAIERPFPAKTEEEKRGTPAEVPDAVRDAALTCGRALGLELYGVDFLFDPDDRSHFWVVDVNAFPSYKGIDGAVEQVVDYLSRRAQAAQQTSSAEVERIAA
jgi:ribosomal protein S6--L-glutamate ligase